MVILIFKRNPLIKNSCVEIAIAEIICKTLLKRNSRPPSVLSKMVSLVKIASHTRKLCQFQFQRKILLQKTAVWK